MRTRGTGKTCRQAPLALGFNWLMQCSTPQRVENEGRTKISSIDAYLMALGSGLTPYVFCCRCNDTGDTRRQVYINDKVSKFKKQRTEIS